MPDAPGVAWIDGRVLPLAEARVPVTDRGFLFADSVFDTIRTYSGRPFLLGDHLDRLRRSADALTLPVPWSDAFLTDAIDSTLVARRFAGDAAIRVMVTRGEGGSGLAFPEPTVPRLVILCRPAPAMSEDARAHGVSLARPDRSHAKARTVPGHVKSGAYLPNVLALREGRSQGGFEALLVGDDGSWSEATTSNLFAVLDGQIVTPGEAAGILPGITRALVLAVARSRGLTVTVRSLWDVDLDGADELLVTSSIKEVLPAVLLDGQPVGRGEAGPVTRTLQRGFRDAVEALGAHGARRMVELFP